MREHLYYYRDVDQNEIDLVIDTSDTLYPIEFKKTAAPNKTLAKNFQLLEKFGKKVGHGAILCFVTDILPISHTVTAVPIGLL